MTLHQAKPARFTIEEYLRLEADAVEKHEYRDGEIVAMAGGSPQHSLVIANLIREVGNRLKGKPCRVYDSNLRVRVARTTLYTYPDLTVICGDPEFDPQDRNRTTVVNPRLVVEVLSPATEAEDRGEKFIRYLQIDSLQEYVLVSQLAPRVETYFRRGDGSWLFTPAAGLEALAKLRSLEIDLPLAEAYAGIEFPPEPSPPESGEPRTL
jgi:Uma2 family endonuclease